MITRQEVLNLREQLMHDFDEQFDYEDDDFIMTVDNLIIDRFDDLLLVVGAKVVCSCNFGSHKEGDKLDITEDSLEDFKRNKYNFSIYA